MPLPTLRAIAAALLLAVAASSTMYAQTAPSATSHGSKPWHLSAAQLAAECRGGVGETRARLDTLLARRPAEQTFANTLRPIEDAVGALYNRTSVLANLYVLSPDKSVRDSSTACSQLTSNYYVEVNADPRIYGVASHARSAQLPRVDRVLAARWEETLRHGGAALDSAKRAHATAMLKRLNDLSRDFNVALSSDSTRIALSDSEIAPLPEQLRGQLVRSGAEQLLPVDESTIGLFLRNEPRSDARHRYLLAYERRGGMPNLARLREAVAIRDSLAHVFGFPNWAAYQLDVKVAKTPQRATDFIRRIDEGLLAKARQELAELAPVAERDSLRHAIEPWDVSYYSEKLRQTRYAVNTNEVRKYFPVEHVVRSVLDIYQELFGLALHEVTPPDVWAPGVREFSVSDAASGRVLGTAYLDLFPRPDKYDHFAAFPMVQARRLPDGTRQLPVVAIVGNWPAPGGKEPALLSHGDVVVFFHEFGHAVDMLSDTSPYISIGTGGLRQDFVEAPSQMLENWMWEPAVLARVSKHVETGRPLPDSLIARMLALKHFRDGLNGTAQAFYSAYDLALHSGDPSVDPLVLWNRLSAELTPIPDIEGSFGPASFGHLMGGYDAGYYGYLWSKVYAQDLYTRFSREGPMNRATGRAYRETVLAPAATEEPDALLQRFLGRPLSYDAFFAEMGIAPAKETKPTP
jgi:Zn-dependent oligopeptidase